MFAKVYEFIAETPQNVTEGNFWGLIICGVSLMIIGGGAAFWLSRIEKM